MSNQVDLSQEVIEGEWARIMQEHEAGELPKVEQSAEGENLKFEKPRIESDPVAGQLQLADKIQSAELVIMGGLRFVFDAIGGLKISDDQYRKMAHAWAVVIAKRFENGIFDFLAKYRDELQAVVATVAFLGAVRAAAQVKREALEAEREKARGDDDE